MGILLCGKSCVDDSERIKWQEREAIAAKDSIRDEFETGYLSEEARMAAEITAMQKLKDLADYLKIFSDGSMDPVFREKAGDMIRELFISGDIRLSFGQTGDKKRKGLTVDEFLSRGFGGQVVSAEIIFNDIRVTDHFERNHQDNYSGKMHCIQTLRLYTLTDSILTHPRSVSVEIFSSMTSKVFGSDTLSVWNVFLGQMEFTD